MEWPKKTLGIRLAIVLLSAAALVSCASNGNGDGDGDGDVNAKAIPAANMTYVVFAWNDLGMHCANPTYDKAVLLPPYNTLWVQVVKRATRRRSSPPV